MSIPVLYTRSPWGQFGSSLGQGLADTYKEQYQYNLNQSRLNKALGELENYKGADGQSFEQLPIHQQIAVLGKSLLNAPGGSQLLGELAPVLQKQYKANQQARAQREAIDRRNTRRQQPPPQGSPQAQPSPLGMPPASQGEMAPMPQQAPLNPAQWIAQQTNQAAQNASRLGPTLGAPPLRRSAEEIAPRRSVSPEPIQRMTPDDMQEMALDIVDSSGGQVTYPEALQQVKWMAENATEQNKLLQQEKDRQIQREGEIAQGGNSKFENQFAKKNDWDSEQAEHYHTLYNKYLKQASDSGLESDNKIYDFAARRLQRRINAEKALENSISRPNAIKNVWNGLMGEGKKTVDQSIDELRNKLTPIIEDGDYDYVRKVLSNDLGFGPVEVKMVLNPMSAQEKEYMDSKIPKSAPYYKETSRLATRDMPFPLKGNTKMRVDPAKKEQLVGAISDSVTKILNTYPNADLVLMRREFLNRGYDWNSLSEGINKAINNNPDIRLNSEQEKDLNTLIDRPPQVGLYQIFQNLIFGKE